VLAVGVYSSSPGNIPRGRVGVRKGGRIGDQDREQRRFHDSGFDITCVPKATGSAGRCLGGQSAPCDWTTTRLHTRRPRPGPAARIRVSRKAHRAEAWPRLGRELPAGLLTNAGQETPPTSKNRGRSVESTRPGRRVRGPGRRINRWFQGTPPVRLAAGGGVRGFS